MREATFEGNYPPSQIEGYKNESTNGFHQEKPKTD